MQPLADAAIKILAEMIVICAINALPFRRLKSIDETLKGLRRDTRRIERRIDAHDRHAGIDTRSTSDAV